MAKHAALSAHAAVCTWNSVSAPVWLSEALRADEHALGDDARACDTPRACQRTHLLPREKPGAPHSSRWDGCTVDARGAAGRGEKVGQARTR
eukprot:6505722-Prymnesium_polylepis.2